MQIVFLGVNDVGMQIYDWLCQRDDTEVIAMLTQPEQLSLVKEKQPDILLSVGFDHLVPEGILSTPSNGAFNLHPSYLPHNRGKSPNVWPLIEETPAGVTLHHMDAEFDTGNIVSQRKVRTEFSDTGEKLHQRLEDAQFELFTDTWPEIVAGEVETKPQDDIPRSYHSEADFTELCELDPNEKVRINPFLNRLRALTFPPFDNAYVEIEGEKYYVDIEIRKETGDSGEQTKGLVSSY